MGLKRNASSNRAQRPTKRTKRLIRASVRVRRGERRGNAFEANGSNNELVKGANDLLEENLLEVPVHEENIWPHLEGILDEETEKRRQRAANKGVGGGGRPETAANQP
ncbi:hypothetical protein ACFXTO_009406 [Malus domestica]